MKIKILFKVKNNKIKKLKKNFIQKDFNYINIKTKYIFYNSGPPILANLQVIWSSSSFSIEVEGSLL